MAIACYCEWSFHLPLVGVNTFLPPDGHGEVGYIELMRSPEEEKLQQVANVETFRNVHADEAAPQQTPAKAHKPILPSSFETPDKQRRLRFFRNPGL